MHREPTDDDLLRLLLDGEADEEALSRLAGLASVDRGFADRIAGELRFTEMLRQALVSGGVDAAAEFESALAGAARPFDELLQRVRSGEASISECNRVARHLWESPADATTLRRRLAEDEWLHQALARSKGEEAFIASLETRMWAETKRDHFVDDFARRLERELPPIPEESTKVVPFPWTATALKMTAAAAALAIGAYFAAQGAAGRYVSAPATASVVKATPDATWTEGASPRPDGSLRPGIYELQRGVVSLRLARGGDLTVEGPARFEVGEDASANVHAGIVLARAPQGEGGISLRSRNLSISEPARLIGIDARAEESTEAVVFNGAGGICLGEIGKCRELSAFEAVKADHARGRLVDVPYNPRAFSKAWAMLAGVENQIGPVRLELPGSVISAAGGVAGEVRVFVENESFRPQTGLEVDRVVAGEFALAEPNPGESLEARGELRSYLLQLTPSDGKDTDGAVETSLTFDFPVVGVIFSSDRLDSSDESVGASFAEEIGPERRGLESGADELLLSEDRRTLNLRFKGGGNHAEQVRVFVALN